MRPRTPTVAGAAEELALADRPGRTSFPFHPGASKSRRSTLGCGHSTEVADATPGTQIKENAAFRSRTDHESTLKTDRYTLTQQNFPSYSVPMDAELAALEEKIRQTAALCSRLRDENRELQARLATLASDKSRLTEKVDGARARLETLLRQIPE